MRQCSGLPLAPNLPGGIMISIDLETAIQLLGALVCVPPKTCVRVHYGLLQLVYHDALMVPMGMQWLSHDLRPVKSQPVFLA